MAENKPTRVLVVDDGWGSFPKKSGDFSMLETAISNYLAFKGESNQETILSVLRSEFEREFPIGYNFSDLRRFANNFASRHSDLVDVVLEESHHEKIHSLLSDRGIELTYAYASEFNDKNALERISQIPYDVLLLDMGFPTTIDNLVISQDYTLSVFRYLVQQQEAPCFGFKSKSTLSTNTPNKPKFIEKSDSVDAMEILNSDGKESSYHNFWGGLNVAKELMSRGIKYTFWTNDFSHAYKNVELARATGVLSVTAFDKYTQDNGCLEPRTMQDRENFYSTPVISLDGQLMTYFKDLSSSNTPEFHAEQIEKMVNAAKAYQAN